MTDRRVPRHRREQAVPRRKRLYRWYAAVLALTGVVLIGVASCSSSTPPPQPSADAAGSIDEPASDLSSGDSSASEPSPSQESGTKKSSAPSSAAASSRTSIPTPSAGTPKTASSAKPSSTPTSKAPTSKAPAPSSSSDAPTTKSSIVVPSFELQEVKGPVLPKSRPVSLQIPTLGVDSPTSDMSLLPDKTIEVPPLEDTNATGWYDGSPTPGEQGPSVFLGHVDSAKNGPSVFYDLGTLKPGDEVDVTREDGTVAVFKIDGVRSYGKNEFPTKEVYGNLDHAGLRLITCGGTFDPNVGHYESNIIAFGSLVSSR